MSASSTKLPTGWASVRVDRVGAVRLGRQRSPDKHTGKHATKYLRAANIKPAGLDLTDILEMDFTPTERSVFGLQPGDILLTEASGSSSQVGRAAMWSGEIAECCYQNTIIRFRPHAATPEYALTVFRHYAASGAFGRLARGVGIQHLGASRFAGLAFPLPPLEEQKRIAKAVENRLREIRDADAHLRTALQHLEAQRKEILATAVRGQLVERPAESNGAAEVSQTLALMGVKSDDSQKSLFEKTSADDLPSDSSLATPTGWAMVRVDQAGEVRLGRQRSPEHHRGQHLRPYLRVANVLEDRVDVTEVYQMNFTPEEYEVYSLQDGDILLNEGQSIELVGRPAMFRNEMPGVCFQNTLIRFRSSAAINPEFGEPAEVAIPPSADKQEKTSKGGSMKRKSGASKANDHAARLSEVLRKAGHSLALPELFALAGFDRDEPEQVELFYLALRGELNRTIKQIGTDAENALLESIGDAS